MQFTKPTTGINKGNNVGYQGQMGNNVANGICPFCQHQAGFSQVGEGSESMVNGDMVALKCNNCRSIFSADIEGREAYPKPTPSGIDDVPEGVSEYYEEGLRCISSNAPNGAAALFRKVIEAICVEYGVTDIHTDDSIYDMVQKLAEEDHITEEHRKSLLALKDAGNDAAHLNDNDPSLEQARNLKQLVESVMTATVVAKHRVERAREDHPNPYEEDDENGDE